MIQPTDEQLEARAQMLRDGRGYINAGALELINGIWVNRIAYDQAPHPIMCPGHDDGTDCDDDPQDPCRACILYDEASGGSNYWDNPENT